MIFSLHSVSVQLASTCCTFDKRKMPSIYSIQWKVTQNIYYTQVHVWFSLVKLLREIRNVSYYSTNLHRDLHICRKVLEGGTERRRVQLPQPSVSIRADAQTQAHPCEDGKWRPALEEGPSAACTSGSYRPRLLWLTWPCHQS